MYKKPWHNKNEFPKTKFRRISEKHAIDEYLARYNTIIIKYKMKYENNFFVVSVPTDDLIYRRGSGLLILLNFVCKGVRDTHNTLDYWIKLNEIVLTLCTHAAFVIIFPLQVKISKFCGMHETNWIRSMEMKTNI